MPSQPPYVPIIELQELEKEEHNIRTPPLFIDGNEISIGLVS